MAAIELDRYELSDSAVYGELRNLQQADGYELAGTEQLVLRLQRQAVVSGRERRKAERKAVALAGRVDRLSATNDVQVDRMWEYSREILKQKAEIKRLRAVIEQLRPLAPEVITKLLGEDSPYEKMMEREKLYKAMRKLHEVSE